MKEGYITGREADAVAEKFKRWLNERGAEVLEPTNQYEVVRFKTGKGIGILYKKGGPNQYCSMVGECAQAWYQFIKPSSSWRAIPATKRRINVDPVVYKSIRKRDGDDCFYCALPIPEYEGTIEHLVSLTHGGPEHISNKFLAHKECNIRAGTLSAVEKIHRYHLARMEKLLRNINEQGRRDRRASAESIAQARCEADKVHNEQ
jgi:5-methylcytosine-specific restriction endonuclease McrA